MKLKMCQFSFRLCSAGRLGSARGGLATLSHILLLGPLASTYRNITLENIVFGNSRLVWPGSWLHWVMKTTSVWQADCHDSSWQSELSMTTEFYPQPPPVAHNTIDPVPSCWSDISFATTTETRNSSQEIEGIRLEETQQENWAVSFTSHHIFLSSVIFVVNSISVRKFLPK